MAPPKIATGIKKCTLCGVLFRRGKYADEHWEKPADFRKRKYCSRQCAVKHHHMTGAFGARWGRRYEFDPLGGTIEDFPD